MSADTVYPLLQQLDALGWDYSHDAHGGDHRVTLAVTKLDGAGMLQLFNLLNPDGQPLPGVSAALEANRGVVIG